MKVVTSFLSCFFPVPNTLASLTECRIPSLCLPRIVALEKTHSRSPSWFYLPASSEPSSVSLAC